MTNTTVGEQLDIFMHYVHELETLDIPILAGFEGEWPADISAQMKYNRTRKNALEPLDLMITHCDDSETVEAIEKTKTRFLEKYPEK